MGRMPQPSSSNRLLIALIAATSLACASPTEVCTTELRASLEVDVVEAGSGLPAAAGATVVVQGATVYDSVTAAPTATTLRIAAVWYEDFVTAGTYTVRVRKPGYQPWEQSNVQVRAGRCHVQGPLHLTAILVPNGSGTAATRRR